MEWRIWETWGIILFKIILNISLKSKKKKTDNPSLRIYVNKIENRMRFKIKKGYYLKLLITETLKLLGSNKSKITKDKNGEACLISKL